MTTESEIPPDDDALATSMTDLLSGTFSSPYSDLIAGQLSDATASLVMLDEAPMAFEDVADRLAFAVGFTAANTGTPIPDLLDVSLADFLAWHRQAARLAGGQHRVSMRLVTAAIETLAANPSIFQKEAA